MHDKRIAIGLLAGLVVACSLLVTCSKKSTLPTEPPVEPATLTVTPSHGAPGAPVRIDGYAVDPADSTITLLIGGSPTVFRSDSGMITALVPLFMDSTADWPTIPAGPQDILIRKGTATVALGSGALTIDSLPHADGAAESIRQDLRVIANSLRTIWGSLPDIPGSDERIPGYRQAIMAMLDSATVGADSSMQAVINGNSSWADNQTPDLALEDALLASCGALEFFDEAAASLGQVNDTIAKFNRNSIYCRDGGSDMDLACEMQIYVLLDDYKNNVVKPTTQTYAETVGLATGLVAISGFPLKSVAIINALLAVFDFVYGTLAPSLFPAEITAFTLDLDSDTIGVHDHTSSTVTISAVNHPATIKATDVLESLLTSLGLAGAPSVVATSFREVLWNAIQWALGLYRQGLIAYNNDHGGSVFIDPSADLPQMVWGPITVTSSDLVELYSFDPAILAEDTLFFEWEGLEKGEGTIQARGRTAGDRSKVLIDNALCLGCIYSGGAFGNNAPATETKQVVVGKQARLDVSITGLPNGVDGSVIVNGPGSYTSGELTSSATLHGLDPGDYHLTATEVTDGSGHAFDPEPVDTTVTLSDGDSAAVEVHYTAKYGSLLVTVAGLSTGVEADIDLSGSGVAVHIVTDTLIDSLPPGIYTVVAGDVVDQSGGETLTADPPSQTVEVVGNQTASCAVTYGGGITMQLQVGNPFLLIDPIGHYPYIKWSEATYTVNDVRIETADDRYYNGQNGPGPNPAFECNPDGVLMGGDPGNSVSSTAVTSAAGTEGIISFASISDTLMGITFSGYANADVATDSSAAVASLQLQTWGWAVLVIDNKTVSNWTLWYDYDFSCSSTGTFPSQVGWAARMYLGYNVQHTCSALGIADWPYVKDAFQLDGPLGADTTLQYEDQLISIPPGITYFQIMTDLRSVASSSTTNGNSYSQAANFQGTIHLSLRK